MSERAGNATGGVVVLVTVGSTRFDDLTNMFLQNDIYEVLAELGCRKVVIQYGAAKRHIPSGVRHIHSNSQDVKVDVEAFDYKPSLAADFERADIVIGHAGAGTILETLRDPRRRMVVVVNSLLMSNHQSELALKMDRMGHLKACTLESLLDTLASITSATFSPYDQSSAPQRIMRFVTTFQHLKHAKGS